MFEKTDLCFNFGLGFLIPTDIFSTVSQLLVLLNIISMHKFFILIFFCLSYFIGNSQEKITDFKKEISREFNLKILGELEDKLLLSENSETLYFSKNTDSVLNLVDKFPKNVSISDFFVVKGKPYFVVSPKIRIGHFSEIWTCDNTFQKFELVRELVNEIKVIKLDSALFIHDRKSFYKIGYTVNTDLNIDTLSGMSSSQFSVLDNRILYQEQGPASDSLKLVFISSTDISQFLLPKSFSLVNIELLHPNHFYLQFSNNNLYSDYLLDLATKSLKIIDEPYNNIYANSCFSSISKGQNSVFSSEGSIVKLSVEKDEILSSNNCPWRLNLFEVKNYHKSLKFTYRLNWPPIKSDIPSLDVNLNAVSKTLLIDNKIYFMAFSITIGAGFPRYLSNDKYIVSIDISSGQLDTVKFTSNAGFWQENFVTQNDNILLGTHNQAGVNYQTIFDTKKNTVNIVLAEFVDSEPTFKGEKYSYLFKQGNFARVETKNKAVVNIPLPKVNSIESTIENDLVLEKYLIYAVNGQELGKELWIYDGKINRNILKELDIQKGVRSFKFSENKILNKYLLVIYDAELSYGATFDVEKNEFELVSKFDSKLVNEYLEIFNYHNVKDVGFIIDFTNSGDLFISGTLNESIVLRKSGYPTSQYISKVFPNGNTVVRDYDSINILDFIKFPFKESKRLFNTASYYMMSFETCVLAISEGKLFSIDEQGKLTTFDIEIRDSYEFKKISENEAILNIQYYDTNNTITYYINTNTLKFFKVYEKKLYGFPVYLGKVGIEHLFFIDKTVLILNKDNLEISKINLSLSNLYKLKEFNNRLILVNQVSSDYPQNITNLLEYKNGIFKNVLSLNSLGFTYDPQKYYYDRLIKKYVSVEFSESETVVKYQEASEDLGQMRYYSDSISVFSTTVFTGGFGVMIPYSFQEYTIMNKQNLKILKAKNLISNVAFENNFVFFSKTNANEVEYYELSKEFELENKTSQSWKEDEVITVGSPFLVGNTYCVFAFSKNSGKQLWKLTSQKEVLVLGNENKEKKELLTLFPNPAASEISIKLSGEVSDFSNYSISDNSGRIVKKGQINSGQRINLEGLSQGLYFMTVEIGKKSETIRFLKL